MTHPKDSSNVSAIAETPSNASPWSKDALLSDALERLEWTRLTDALAELAALQHSKKRLKALTPWLAAEEREWFLRATERLLQLQIAGDALILLPFDATYFIDALKHGALLNGLGLFHLGVFCSQIERLGQKARNELKKSGGGSLGPELAELLSGLQQQTSLARRLALAADENGRLLDTASAELKDARQKHENLTRKMTHNLENTLKIPSVRDALQDTVWMIRDGRYVLPVRADRKSDVAGIPRGVSASGSTLFVEPAGLSELQSQLSAAEADVMLAENRVLRAFSDEAYSLRDELLQALDILETFDCVSARARLASRLQAVKPSFHNNPNDARFEIYDAQHPLYVLEDKPCVPNNLLLQPRDRLCPRVWVLSGPNAGGKTVAMRTVGLHCAMALAGLFIPARKAHFFEFDSIYVEMGDRQDRREDLSTFSGHLMHVLKICELADTRTMILLDEGFVGTDPSIGSAMAQATLETLAERGATSIITTHFSSLKALADKQPNVFANASMEFEPERLKPTFHLLNGVPGQSFAVELARRLQYPENILQRAIKYRGEREIELENLLAELQKSRHELRVELDKNKRLNEQLEDEVSALHAQRKDLEGQQQSLLNEFTSKLQKRFNAFENRLETRTRQFERAQQQALAEQRELHLQQQQQQTTPESPSHPLPTPVSTRQQAPLKKEEGDKRKGMSLSDFSQLARIKMELPAKKADWEEAEDERAWHKERRPQKLSQRDLLDEARESLDLMQRAFDKAGQSFEERRNELSGEVSHTVNKAADLLSEARNASAQRPAQFWTTGQRIKTAQFDKPGLVLRAADSKGFVECQFGFIKTKLHHSALMTIEESAQKPKFKSHSHTSLRLQDNRKDKNKMDMSIDSVLPTRDNTVDVRGQLVDAAIEHVERFIDKSWREDAHTVVIVHGHGTGRVKAGIREFLQTCSYSLRYRPGSSGEGGDGATVVILD
jgi:DNA mismatch repair protein MutS2